VFQRDDNVLASFVAYSVTISNEIKCAWQYSPHTECLPVRSINSEIKRTDGETSPHEFTSCTEHM
jgi:hypothetical protein